MKISFGKTERAIEENKNIIHQQQLCLNNLLELNRELLTKITAISKKIETIGESGNVNYKINHFIRDYPILIAFTLR